MIKVFQRRRRNWNDLSEVVPSPTMLTLERLGKNGSAILGFIIVLIFVVVGIIGPAIAPHNPNAINLSMALDPPSMEAPMGRDHLGRDILSRVLYGARISLTVGVVAVLIASVIGVPLGLIGGYLGGWLDSVIVMVLDIIIAFPVILLALIMISVLGPDLQNLMVAVGITSMPIFAKLARGSTMSVKKNDYIMAAECIGQRPTQILVRHILPNVTAPLIVQATLRMGTAILTAASLSFLGMGVQPPTPEWGALVSEGRAFLRAAPHISLFPGLVVMLCILGFSLFGDGLNDALNPKIMKNR